MNLLLDTHALIWWFDNDARLSAPAREHLTSSGNSIAVSSVSGWEMATKHRIGKLPGADRIIQALPSLVLQARFAELPISLEHALRAGSLPGPHRDPFDRLLIAQAQLEGLSVVTIDPVFAAYGVDVIW